jgi:hypothetical protein
MVFRARIFLYVTPIALTLALCFTLRCTTLAATQSGAQSQFNNARDAAYAASAKYTLPADNDGVEYGVPIYEFEGKFGYGALTVGDSDVVSTVIAGIPFGGVLVGIWHSHPLRQQPIDHRIDLENFRTENPGRTLRFWTSVKGMFIEQDLNSDGSITIPLPLCEDCTPQPLLSEF